jgi:hypothetical protein
MRESGLCHVRVRPNAWLSAVLRLLEPLDPIHKDHEGLEFPLCSLKKHHKSLCSN